MRINVGLGHIIVRLCCCDLCLMKGIGERPSLMKDGVPDAEEATESRPQTKDALGCGAKDVGSIEIREAQYAPNRQAHAERHPYIYRLLYRIDNT